MGFERVDWIHAVKNNDTWQADVKMVMYRQVL